MSRLNSISEIDILEYIHCPIQYSLYKNKVVPKKILTYKDLLQSITKLFLVKLMDGAVLDLSSIKKEWDKICHKHSSIMDNNKVVDGLSKLILMYKWAENIKLRILDLGFPFCFFIRNRQEENVAVTGNIPTIALNKSNVPELLIIDYSNRHIEQSRLDIDLKYTLYCLAYKRKTGQDLGIHLHNVHYNSDRYSYRNKYDYQRLVKIIQNVCYSIDENIYYPKESVMCASCPTAGACKLWSYDTQR